MMQDYCQNFGVVVNGYYGIEQWEYKLLNGEIDYPVNFLNQDYPTIEIHVNADGTEEEVDITKKYKHRSSKCSKPAHSSSQYASTDFR